MHGVAAKLSFNRRGTLLAVGLTTGAIVIWDFSTRGMMKVLYGHEAKILSLSWSRNGRKIVSACGRGVVFIWDVLSGDKDCAFEFDVGVKLVSFDPRDHMVILVCPTNAEPRLLRIKRLGNLSITTQEAIIPANTDSVTEPPPTPAVPEEEQPTAAAAPLPIAEKGVETGTTESSQTSATTSSEGSLVDSALAAPPNSSTPAAKAPDSIPPETSSIPPETPKNAQVEICILQFKHEGQDEKKSSSSRPELFRTATFNPSGRSIYAGSTRGTVSVFDSDTCSKSSPPSQSSFYIKDISIKDIVFSQDGSYLLINANDRCLRLYDAESPDTCLQVFQDVVTRKQWLSPGFSQNGEYIVAGTQENSRHQINIWSRPYGHLIKMLHDPKDGIVDLLYHPVRPIIVAVVSYGGIHIWGKQYTENWSTFAADFEQLDNNNEYIEREDEFDLIQEEEEKEDKEQDSDIDVGSEYPGPPDQSDELLYLPVQPMDDPAFIARWNRKRLRAEREAQKAKKRRQNVESSESKV